MAIYFDAFGKWETSFQYSAQCSQRGQDPIYPTDCMTVRNDGINWSWFAQTVDGRATQAVSGASNPTGPGGYGMRQWKGSGADNRQSGGLYLTFSGGHDNAYPEPEIWLRWYQRYESGFYWANGIQAGSKEMYLRSSPSVNNPGSGGGNPYIGYGFGGLFRVYDQTSGGLGKNRYGNRGWDDDYPGGVSDGSWHCYEVYMKRESSNLAGDGILKMWYFGELIGEFYDMYWNVGAGFCYIVTPSNQKDPGLSRLYYLDIDDICLYRNPPPGRDAQNFPIIGPIGASSAMSVGSTASPEAGEAPLLTEFTAQAQNGTAPYSYAWNFGDGNNSSAQNPSHTYQTPGSYEAVVTATDAGSIQATSSHDIVVTDPDITDQKFTDFDEYSSGVKPSDWTIRDDANVDWHAKVKDGFPLLAALPDSDPSGPRRFISWNEIGVATNVEVVFIYRSQESIRGGGVYLRSDGNPATTNTYQIYVSSGEFRIRRLIGGTPTVLHSAVTALTNVDVWYAMRVRVETLVNTNVRIRATHWTPNNINDITADEPLSWTYDYEDTHANRILTAGYAGFAVQRNTQEIDFGFLGVGIGGAEAPALYVATPPAEEPGTGNLIMTDENWDSENWYDGSPGPIIDGVLHWNWLTGNIRPEGATTARRYIPQEVTEFLLEMEIHLSSNWRGSGVNWHPHLFHIPSKYEGEWSGLSISNSMLYFELFSETTSPYNTSVRFAHQDSLRVNFDHGSVPNNLINTTENRSSNHCNTPAHLNDMDEGDCFHYSGSNHYSASRVDGGIMPKGQWVRCRWYFKKNTMTGGVANFDGIVRMWIGTTLVFESTIMCFVAGAFHTGHAWDKFVIAPYMDTGSPIDQTMMVRNMRLYDGMASEPTPDPPPGAELIGDWSNTVAWDDTTPIDSNFLKFTGTGHINAGGNGFFKVI